MKYVIKGQSPVSFEQWKGQANEEWQPSYSLLANPEKRELHQTLLVEQGWVCCYCGRGIEIEKSHIEHFRPQEHYSELELCFENLHASCLRQLEPRTPLSCGHAKKSDFDETRFISPQDPKCESRFKYNALGEIIPADASDQSAVYMIGLLKLDSPELKGQRFEAIEKALPPTFLATLSDEELKLMRDKYRAPDPDGKLTPFGHVVSRYAAQYLPAAEPETIAPAAELE